MFYRGYALVENQTEDQTGILWHLTVDEIRRRNQSSQTSLCPCRGRRCSPGASSDSHSRHLLEYTPYSNHQVSLREPSNLSSSKVCKLLNHIFEHACNRDTFKKNQIRLQAFLPRYQFKLHYGGKKSHYFTFMEVSHCNDASEILKKG